MAGPDDSKNTKAQPAPHEPRVLGRRELLKGLSTVPALGLFGYAWQRQRRYQQSRAEEAVATANAPTAGLQAFASFYDSTFPNNSWRVYNAYDVIPGFVGAPVGTFEEHMAGPARAEAKGGAAGAHDRGAVPVSDEDLLAKFLLGNL